MRRKAVARRSLVWSAGCSTGEEPYTLAMVLSEYAAAHPGFRFRMLATDICTDGAEQGRAGRFQARVVRRCPRDLAAKVFHAQPRSGVGQVRVVPELRALIEFRRLNFMDADLRPSRAGGHHLLPQRDHLLRPRHAGADAGEADRDTWRREDIFSSAIRKPCRRWTAADAGRACAIYRKTA